MNLSDYSKFANQLADHTRAIALAYFRQPLDVEQKADHSPVSQADKQIEQLMREQISLKYPEHGIFGEEYGNINLSSDWLWVIDPIDGTKSFITGQPCFGTLIALLYHGKPVMGIIDIPALDERWVNVQGQPTLFNQHMVKTRCTKELQQSICSTTSIDFFNPKELQIYDRISKSGPFRLFGGDCYNYGLLASGFIDIVIEANLKPYDFMATVPIIEGAGGVITDWQGKALKIQTNSQVLACANPQLHELCLEEITKIAI